MGNESKKSIAGLVLVVVAVGAAVLGVRREAAKGTDDPVVHTAEADAPASADVPARPEPVTVYYFHGDTRCKTCRAIEDETERILTERFAEELASNDLRFERVNFDTPENQHFLTDYDLAFGTVLVQGTGPDDPFENLADVWTLIHEESAEFEAYVAEHVQAMLDARG